MMRVGVIGSGAMGSGIAQVAAMGGHEVMVYDAMESSRVSGRDAILASLNKLAEKQKMTDAEAKGIFGKIYFTETLHSFAETDIIIEAIIEDEAEKKKIFAQLEQIVSVNAIIASNTSSISITALAKSLNHPSRCIGIHFFNPPVLMKLVEIIPALQTGPEIISTCKELMASWGKIVVIAKDTPGFIVNRIARPFYSEALRIAEEQQASPAQIDAAMKAAGFKMGPFELMDYIGNDINLAVTKSVWTAMYFDPRYKPSLMQENVVRAGWLGRKTGKGYFEYSTPQLPTEAHPDPATISDRILAMLINEAADALYMGVASKEDIDLAMQHGVNYPKGLIAWADEIGIENIVIRIDRLYELYHEDRYRCSAGLRLKALTHQPFYA